MSPTSLITPVVQRWIDDARGNPDAFWDRAARRLPWFRTWDTVFEWTPPTFRWFSGAQTNLAYNAVDYHVANGRGGHAALIYVNERGDRAVYTYAQLLYEVKRVAAALRAIGIGKGDRITVYMPTSPEAIMLMLATVRIGAIHSVVFAGFGANALGDRLAASGSKAVFTADVTYRKGKDVELRQMAKYLAQKARETGLDQQLGPLNPYERRIVHLRGSAADSVLRARLDERQPPARMADSSSEQDFLRLRCGY